MEVKRRQDIDDFRGCGGMPTSMVDWSPDRTSRGSNPHGRETWLGTLSPDILLDFVVMAGNT